LLMTLLGIWQTAGGAGVPAGGELKTLLRFSCRCSVVLMHESAGTCCSWASGTAGGAHEEWRTVKLLLCVFLAAAAAAAAERFLWVCCCSRSLVVAIQLQSSLLYLA
jgi:hypothetical protein